MSDCDDQNVDCSRPECRDKCGWLQWFGNLTNCTVILQYQTDDEGIWHSLGEYGPNQHTELGGGVLLMPQNVNLRAIRIPPAGTTRSPDVVASWGRLGPHVPSLVLSPDRCRESDPQRLGQDNPADHNPALTSSSSSSVASVQVAFSPSHASSGNCQKGSVCINWVLFGFICSLLGVAIVLAVWGFIKSRS